MSVPMIVLKGADSLDEVVSHSALSVVFFAAEWSAGCHLLEPIILKLALRFKGQIGFCRVDIDLTEGAAKSYGIREFPTLLFFADGSPEARIDGLASEQEIFMKLKSFIQWHDDPEYGQRKSDGN